jgi:hypothetical protein
VRVLPVRKLQNNNGFSLTEVLFAMGTLAVAMLFIAGVFPVALYFSTYNINDINMPYLSIRWQTQTRFNDVDAFPATFGIDPNEFAYPSDPRIHVSEKRYFWSALCRQVEPGTRLVQVTVFVGRKVGEGGRYWVREPITRVPDPVGWYPVPIDVNVVQVGPDANEILIDDVISGDNVDEITFINDGYTIVDNQTGQIYRVLERYADDPGTAVREDGMIRLDRPWRGGQLLPGLVWVVPPPANGGRYPCIAIYQKVIRF